MASRDSGTVRPTKRKRVFLAAAVLLLVCVLAAGAVSAEKTICVNTEDDFKKALGSLSEDTKIVVMGDITLDHFTYPFNKNNFNLILTTEKDKNHTISWKSGDPVFSQFGMFYVEFGKHLTIIGNGTGTLTLNDKSNGPQTLKTLIMIGDTGYFTLGVGGILANNTADRGGAVYMTGGTFTMEGGTIANNTADHGGAVYMAGGTFTMKGGTIANNTATSESTGGGAVYMTGGIFTMSGGTIANNTATSGFGGALSVDGSNNEVRITLSGTAKISNNTATNGGGVYMTGGRFTMIGGTIANNTATSGFGGALSVDGSNNNVVDITLSGTAKISNNTATNGGGVFMKGSGTKITLSNNAEISNNKAVSGSGGMLDTGHGGGVHVDDGTFSISGSVIITNNEAEKDGGGVYVHSAGTFVMSGGEISDNTAATNGGGVCANTTGVFEMSNGKITENEAMGSGGGVCMKDGSHYFTMSGGTIIKNSAANGNGVYVGSIFNLKGDGTVDGVYLPNNKKSPLLIH